MAVTLKKKKTPVSTSKTTETVGTTTLESTANELIETKLRVDSLMAELSKDPRYSEMLEATEAFEQQKTDLKKLVGTTYNPTQNFKHTHNGVTVSVSAQASKTTLDKEKVVDALEGVQEGLALELANFTLTNVKKYLSEVELEKVSNKANSGSRSISVK
jgi:hypothetical protein